MSSEAERDKFITAYRIWKSKEAPEAHPEMVHSMAAAHWNMAAGAMWQAARDSALKDVYDLYAQMYVEHFGADIQSAIEKLRKT